MAASGVEEAPAAAQVAPAVAHAAQAVEGAPPAEVGGTLALLASDAHKDAAVGPDHAERSRSPSANRREAYKRGRWAVAKLVKRAADAAGRRAASRARHWSEQDKARHAIEHAALRMLYRQVHEQAESTVRDEDLESSDSD